MRARVLVCITLAALCHPQLGAQTLTTGLPARAQSQMYLRDAGQSSGERGAVALTPQSAGNPSAAVQEDPSAHAPIARQEYLPLPGVPVQIQAQHESKSGTSYELSGDVEIHYRDYVIRSQDLRYDSATNEANSPQQVEISGGPDHEHIVASSGTFNLSLQKGRFYNVVGTLSVDRPNSRGEAANNPFLFTGRLVVKEGPQHYTIYDGSVTSCALPNPDWKFSAGRIFVDANTARIYNSVFRLVDVPVFFFPYASHAVDATGRQSGFLIPIVGTSTSKGKILGEEYYWAINRSMDLMLGLEYYSKRGFAQMSEFRYKGTGDDFLRAHYSGLIDRGIVIDGVLQDQGGQDALVSGRRALGEYARAVANVEYLSSYVYREAFAESFAQAINSEVKSTALVTHEKNGFAETAMFARYQNFESTTPGDEIRILHIPTLEVQALDHTLGPAYWSGETSADGLIRREPGFKSGGIVERVDLQPKVTLPWMAGGWSFRADAGARETFYGRSQSSPGTFDPMTGVIVPIERNASINRKDLEAAFELRPPALERTFKGPHGSQLKHTVEPILSYRFVGGIDNFLKILRFDSSDVVSNTNEVKYQLTQRLFVKWHALRPCKLGEKPESPGIKLCSSVPRQVLSWTVAQKYFLDPNFGGAIIDGRRNVLDTTLDFTGTAFLNAPRNLSPVVSRLRFRSTEKTDLEWDLDYDPKAGRINSSNVFADYRAGPFFTGISHSRLIAVGDAILPTGVSQTVDYNQIRFLLGYANPSKRGLSAAADAGVDLNQGTLQYGAVQSSYNWDCCGLSVEYRYFSLGTVRNESQFRFNLTLAGVGTAGNLRRAERLF